MNTISVHLHCNRTATLALAFLLTLIASVVQAQSPINIAGTGIGAIPESGSGQLDISFAVSGQTTLLNPIRVAITLNHTFAGDLTATLISPAGRSLALFYRVGPNDSSNFNGTYTFSDNTTRDLWAAATAAATTDAVIAGGEYRASAQLTGAPVSMSAAFAGLTPAQVNGAWILRIQDSASGDVGSVTAASLTLALPPPPNDNFASRTLISGVPPALTANNSGATLEVGEPNSTRTRSIWYAWTAPATGLFTIDTNGSAIDTVLGVYTGNVLASLVLVAENDDGGAGLDSRVQLPATAGQTYQIRLSQFGSGIGGEVKLNIRPLQAPNDLNGDGKSDLLFRDTTTGEVQAKLMNGAAVISGAGLVGAGAWTVAHSADFNADGKADLLWRNTNGTTILWLMNGTNAVSSAVLLGADPSWSITHIGDFNGDSKADILWRNTNGAVILWIMDGANVAISAVLLSPDANWRITHVADFNGDGRADILWRHTNGAVTQWLMNSAGVSSSTALLGPDAGWRVTHTGDFDDDGNADLLWRNATNGAVIQWRMNGSAVAGSTLLLGPDANWSVSHVGDFDGNRTADILWRNLDGSVSQWRMSGSTASGTTVLLGPDPGWRVSHVTDYNGDGRADILWRNTIDGSINMWLMNGGVPLSTAGILGPSPWVVIP